MQLNSQEPIVTFSMSMSQEDAQSWILEKAVEIQKLAALKSRQSDLQRRLEKLEDEIFEQAERCQLVVGA
ncbi:hypothetical protein V9948_003634 [Providencia rettgeri]|nr:hypothetical protein [Providencia rettgeri]